MNITDRQSLVKALIRTYGADDSNRDCIEQYQRVLNHIDQYSNQKSDRIKPSFNLPQDRIQAWVDREGHPDPVQTIRTAEDLGWLDLDWNDLAFMSLNRLMAWMFSGGSINESYLPRFPIAGETDEARLFVAFDQLDIDYRVTGDNNRQEFKAVPTTAPTTLGRQLVALGAPQQAKDCGLVTSLPPYLDDAPFSTRLAFARTYTQNRAVSRPDAPDSPVELRMGCQDLNREGLVRFLTDLIGEDDVIARGQKLRLSQRAAGLLCDDLILR